MEPRVEVCRARIRIQDGRWHIVRGRIFASLAHQHAVGAARRQAVSQDRAGRASADDDVVEFHNFVPGRAALLKGSPDDRSLGFTGGNQMHMQEKRLPFAQPRIWGSLAELPLGLPEHCRSSVLIS